MNTQTDTMIEDLFAVGAHFGYSKTRRHPSVKSRIFGIKNSVEIIDLEKTKEELAKVLAFVNELTKKGKKILFVGTKSEAKGPIESAAKSAGAHYMSERWIGGLLTNWSEVHKRIDRMNELGRQSENGELSIYTKKERGRIMKEHKDLERYFQGVATLEEMPGALFVVDSKDEDIAVKEARKMKIPVIALSNSDCDITLIDYSIVGNDSSRASIAFFADAIANAIKQTVKGETPLV